MVPLERSVLVMTLDDGSLDKMSDSEPLEQSVLGYGPGQWLSTGKW